MLKLLNVLIIISKKEKYMNDQLPEILNDFLNELEDSYGKLPAAIMDSFIITACKCFCAVSDWNRNLVFVQEFLEEQYS